MKFAILDLQVTQGGKMSANILVLGSGVLGEATGTVLAERGFDITFADVNEGVISRLRDKGHKALLVKEVARPDVDIYMVSVPTYPLDICRDSATAETSFRLIRPTGILARLAT